jgi:hypothetical protein
MARGPVKGSRTTTAAVGTLKPTHWRRWHDVRRPDRPECRIEDLFVGPSGVYVVSYPGTDVHVTGGRAYVSALDTAIERCSVAADAVSDLIPARYRGGVKPVLCSRGDEPVADQVRDVLVTSNLAIGHILRSSPLHFSTSEVAEVSALLEASLEAWPVVPEERRGRPWRRWLVACAAAAAAVATTLTLGPDLADVARLW